MTPGRLLLGAALGAAGTWSAYAWGAHLAAAGAIRRGPASSRKVALTFDDGPDPRWTPRVLDLLAARGVSASFFVVGERARRAPEVVRAIAAAGHEVDNHGWSHSSLWLCGPRRTDEEIGRGHAVIGDLTGRPPRYFRPPWGMVNAAMFAALRRYGTPCVLWSLQPEGLRARDARRQARAVRDGAGPGVIVDLHDAEGRAGAPARLVEALPSMIDALRAAGLEPVTLGELLGRRATA